MERCKLHFGEAEQVYIVDVYNGRAYPWDTEAKRVSLQRRMFGWQRVCLICGNDRGGAT